jgi:hypothetical protein
MGGWCRAREGHRNPKTKQKTNKQTKKKRKNREDRDMVIVGSTARKQEGAGAVVCMRGVQKTENETKKNKQKNKNKKQKKAQEDGYIRIRDDCQQHGMQREGGGAVVCKGGAQETENETKRTIKQ